MVLERKTTYKFPPESHRLSLKSANQIQNISERIFAQIVLRHPNIRLYHEPGMISGADGSRDKMTLPDFLVFNMLLKPPRGIYVEVTLSQKDQNGQFSKARKQKQAKVMKSRGLRYVQLDAKALRNMQRSSQRRR